MTLTALVISDVTPLVTTLARTLSDAGFEVITEARGADAIARARAAGVQLAIADASLRDQGRSGERWLAAVRDAVPHARTIVLVSHSVDTAALAAWRFDAVLLKPVLARELAAIARALVATDDRRGAPETRETRRAR